MLCESRDVPLLVLARKQPVWLHDGNAELQCLFVHLEFLGVRPIARRLVRGYEVRRIELDLVRALGAERLDHPLGRLAQARIVDAAEARVDAAHIINCVRPGPQLVRRKDARAGVQDELDRVVRVHRQAGQLGVCRAERPRDLGDALPVAHDIKREQVRVRELQRIPLERHRGLRDMAQAERRGCVRRTTYALGC